MASTGQFQICCNGTICVELHQPGFRGLFRRAVDADCLQFNARSITVETSTQFADGDSVVLDLQALDLRVEEVRGRVRAASPTPAGRQRLRIDFSNSQRRDTRHCLRQLENLYLQQVATPAATG